MRRKILFITGSMNRTSQMYQISRHLADFDCWFSQLFPDTGLLKTLVKYTNLADGTIIANHFRTKSEKYLQQQGVQIDYEGNKHKYELVVFCTDMIVPKKFRQTKTIWV